MVSANLTSLQAAKLFSKLAVLAPEMYACSSSSTSLPAFGAVVCVVVPYCGSSLLLPSEHFFKYLLAIPIPSYIKCLLKSFPH